MEKHFLGNSEALATRAKHTVAIFWNAESVFELVPTEAAPLSEAKVADLQANGFSLLGFAGIVGGKPTTALEHDLDDASIAALAHAYVRHVVYASYKCVDRLTHATA